LTRILRKQVLSPVIKRFDLDAPEIARKARPGQFVVLRVNEEGERIPLTVADTDPEKGILTIVFQEVGKSTRLLGTLGEGDSILDLIGPLGKATHIQDYGTVVCIGGGVGTPEVYPLAKALKAAGNKVISIIGFRSQELILMEAEMRAASTELVVCTDDGSNGNKGFVTDMLARVIERGEKPAHVFAVGPVIMMKMVSKLTKPLGIPTTVSLNPIMLDATGMCGVCRVDVGGETKFACVDGPEFDGHQVDFDLLMARLRTYLPEEKQSVERFEAAQQGGCCGAHKECKHA
jgi:ferredoxin--NADP+ reductase